MGYEISLLPIEEYNKLIDLAKAIRLKEKINFGCLFLTAKNKDGDLIGAAGVKINETLPRFCHILVKKKYRKRGLSFKLMQETEIFLKRHDFNEYVALIPYENKLMQNYAVKFGFKEYSKNEKGIWFYKRI